MGPLDAAAISRRRLLAAAGTVAAAVVIDVPAAAPAVAQRPPAALATDPFQLGVAAGDPEASTVVLWTRLLGPDGAPLVAADLTVEWELADEPSFTTVVAAGVAPAPAAHGHSVHVVVPCTAPTFYRFRLGDWSSAVGRALPAGWQTPDGELRLATASCQNLEHGYYTAYADLAAWAPELVVFLGDFIYESGWDSGDAVRPHRSPEPTTLDGYRDRYAQYLGDGHLQAARACCPWLVIWDDHEVDNNYAADTSQDDDPPATFARRRAAAYQAWWEHMPVRLELPADTADLSIYRSIAWGDLADFVLLDGRQYRSDQACGDAVFVTDPPCAEVDDPQRTMLGPEQEQWLVTTVAAGTATWPVVAQQTVLSNLRLDNGAVLNFDQWDGYPVERQRLLDTLGAATERLVVLTGDIHLSGAATLPGVGVEFVTTSISSRSLVSEDLEQSLADLFPDLAGVEVRSRGYSRHVVTTDEWRTEYRIVADPLDPDSSVSTWKSFAVAATQPDVIVELPST